MHGDLRGIKMWMGFKIKVNSFEPQIPLYYPRFFVESRAGETFLLANTIVNRAIDFCFFPIVLSAVLTRNRPKLLGGTHFEIQFNRIQYNKPDRRRSQYQVEGNAEETYSSNFSDIER